MSLKRRLKHFLTYGIQKRIRGFERENRKARENGPPKAEVRSMRRMQTTDKGAN